MITFNDPGFGQMLMSDRMVGISRSAAVGLIIALSSVEFQAKAPDFTEM